MALLSPVPPVYGAEINGGLFFSSLTKDKHMIRTSESVAKIIPAMALAQRDIATAHKDAKNDFYKSKYADLASVWEAFREPYLQNNLFVLQSPQITGNIVVLTTRIMHVSGEWIESDIGATAKDAYPQSIGSCVTYLRRYGASALIGIVSDDDDGNASQPGVTPDKRTKVAAVTGETKTKQPAWSPEQKTEGGQLRARAIAASPEAEKAFDECWRKMKYDEPSDTIDALAALVRTHEDIADQNQNTPPATTMGASK